MYLTGLLKSRIERAIIAASGGRGTLQAVSTPNPGQINSNCVVALGTEHYFVKLNANADISMFEAEIEGLHELTAADALKIPEPLCCGQSETVIFLVMEYLKLKPTGDEKALAKGINRLHRHRGERFGWHRDNTIGTTAQTNTRSGNWSQFWMTQRLNPQLELAVKNGFHQFIPERTAQLRSAVTEILNGHLPEPVLVHGDLWSGNCAYLENGAPVLYDPAVYYGDRETDLAMMQLFGGFSPAVLQGSTEGFASQPGEEPRRDVYQLYHLLNHLNLFGNGYLPAVLKKISELKNACGFGP